MSCPKLGARSQKRTLVELLKAAVLRAWRRPLLERIRTSSLSSWQAILTRSYRSCCASTVDIHASRLVPVHSSLNFRAGQFDATISSMTDVFQT
jgi:hypothetical protein